MTMFLASGLILYSLSSFIPLLKTDHWFVRSWDFPRLQFLVIGFIFLVPFVVHALRENKKLLWFLIVPLVAMAFDIYRLYPYSPLSPVESKLTPKRKGEFSVLINNVLQTNEEYEKLHRLIEEKSPDFVFLFEVNKDWTDSLKNIRGYPFRDFHPLENTYGLAFLGKIPVDSIEVKYLVQNDVPSYELKFRPEGNETVTIFAVHPRPPRPDSNSDKRDAELIIVAKKSREIKGPVLVVGDMNDVAWSHTTRLFRRISGLLDPRVGRRPYSTFPALSAAFRFPLDYIFHSEELKLTGLEVLPDINSDHLPLMASFVLSPVKNQESFEKPEKGDQKEAREIIENGTEK